MKEPHLVLVTPFPFPNPEAGFTVLCAFPLVQEKREPLMCNLSVHVKTQWQEVAYYPSKGICEAKVRLLDY